jgi:SAM-dependent methyltransferase
LEVPLKEAAPGEGPSRAAAAPASLRDTAGYYDGLERWTALVEGLRYGGGRRELTVHRALADPRAGGRATVTRLHDLLVESLRVRDGGAVLDAGCGYGGTMLALAAASTAKFLGLTLSTRQAALGRRAIARAGLSSRIEIEVHDYDDPPPGPFDAIVAIEALAHARDPQRTLARLCARLAPQGSIAIVDDMPEDAARGSRDLAAFQAGWRAPALASAAQITGALHDSGLTLLVDRDLSADQRLRTRRRIAALERLNRCLRRIAPTHGLRVLLDSYRGGLALERLYLDRLMSYRLLVAHKSALPPPLRREPPPRDKHRAAE